MMLLLKLRRCDTASAMIKQLLDKPTPYSAHMAYCMQNEDSWESISQELGWTVTDCLNHKLSFKKKDDPKAKHEAMGQHIKRLRAAGWHLLHVMERSACNICQAVKPKACHSCITPQQRDCAILHLLQARDGYLCTDRLLRARGEGKD